MSISFIQNNGQGEMPSLRSWLTNAFESAADQPLPDHVERTRIYATSNIAYRAANKRGDAVSSVPMQILDSAGNPLPDTDSLVKGFQRHYRDTIRRSEITLCFWGYNLLVKRRSENTSLYELRWVNPNLYNRDIKLNGLVGFRITGRRSGLPERYVPKQNSIFLNEMDFNDDFGGVAPAQVAINEILTGIEMSLTKKSFMENRAVPNWIAGPIIGKDSPNTQPTKEDAESLMKKLQSLYKGSRNVGRTMIDRFQWQFTNLTMDFDKIKFTEQTADMYEAVAIAFDMPIALIRESASNYAQAEVARRDWGHSWLMRRCEWYAEAFTGQLLNDPFVVRRYGTGLICKPNFDDVMMLKEDDAQKVNKVNAQVQGGYRDLYSAAMETGVKEPSETLKGYYIWGGIPRHISTIAQVAASTQPSLDTSKPSPLPNESPAQPLGTGDTTINGAGGQQPPALPEAAKEAPPLTGKSICIMIGLSNDAELIDLQSKIKQRMNLVPVKWSAPDTFHVTLVYAPVATDAQIEALKAALNDVSWVDDMTLPIGSLRSFDNLGEYAIHFSLRNNADLIDLQQALVDLCQSLGIQISTYSRPENYKPHITMGYAEQKPTTIIFQSKVRVTPKEFQLGVGDNEIAYRRPWVEGSDPTPPPDEPPPAAKSDFLPDDIFSELKVAVKKSTGFVVNKLPQVTVTYIASLKEHGVDQETVLIAAKSFTSNVVAARALQATRLDFENDFEDLLARARNDEATRQQFRSKLASLLNQYSKKAYIDGLVDGGYQVDEATLDPEDKDAIATILADQSQYVSGLTDVLFKGEGVGDSQADMKPAMWFNKSVMPAYNAGLASAAANSLFEWQRGATSDSCEDCIMLEGQKRRLKIWKKYELMPPCDKTECKGFKCQCQLKPTSGKASSGAFPKLVGARRSHVHEHEEEADKLPEPVV